MAPKLNRMVEDEPFLQFCGSKVIEADAEHAVVEQREAPELDNHAGIRHAGALFTVGFAASRALVVAALGSEARSAMARIVDSEIDYQQTVHGEAVTATAEPVDADWAALLNGPMDGDIVRLPSSVTLESESGKTVAAMRVVWEVRPEDEGGSGPPRRSGTDMPW